MADRTPAETPATARPVRRMISVWDLIEDPDVPHATVQRFLTRCRARSAGLPLLEIPEEDLPHLARHAHVIENEAPRG